MRELDLAVVDPAEVEISLSRLAVVLGYPEGKEIEGRAREVLHEAGRSFVDVARVRWRAVSVVIEDLEPDSVSLEGGVSLGSRALSSKLERAGGEEVVISGITLGAELDERVSELDREGRPDHSFFLDAVSTCAMEVLTRDQYVSVCDRTAPKGLIALPRTAPGYGSWDLSDQTLLAGLLTAEELGISVLESGMLTPLRSTLGLFPLTRDAELASSRSELSPCATCGASDCPYRRAEQGALPDLPAFVPGAES